MSLASSLTDFQYRSAKGTSPACHTTQLTAHEWEHTFQVGALHLDLVLDALVVLCDILDGLRCVCRQRERRVPGQRSVNDRSTIGQRSVNSPDEQLVENAAQTPDVGLLGGRLRVGE